MKTIQGEELSEIIIDSEFRDLLASADSDEERKQLKNNIEVDGCREPIVTWSTEDGDVLIDGHTRLGICKQTGQPLQVIDPPLDFDSRADVLRWMWENQRGRRNMTRQQLSVLRGKLYNETKKAPNRPKGKKPDTENKGGNNCPVKTADKIAAETGVSARTVRTDGKRAEMLDNVKVPEIVKGYKAGKFKMSDASLAMLGKLSKSEQQEVLDRVASGKTEWNKYLDPKRVRDKVNGRDANGDTKAAIELLKKLVRAVDNAKPKLGKKHKECIRLLRLLGKELGVK